MEDSPDDVYKCLAFLFPFSCFSKSLILTGQCQFIISYSVMKIKMMTMALVYVRPSDYTKLYVFSPGSLRNMSLDSQQLHKSSRSLNISDICENSIELQI